jgi:hypothetical protein
MSACRRLSLSLLLAWIWVAAATVSCLALELSPLILTWHKADELCRTGGGDDPTTQVNEACYQRDFFADLIAQRGWCYGKQGQTISEMEWHRCSSSSLKSYAGTLDPVSANVVEAYRSCLASNAVSNKSAFVEMEKTDRNFRTKLWRLCEGTLQTYIHECKQSDTIGACGDQAKAYAIEAIERSRR